MERLTPDLIHKILRLAGLPPSDPPPSDLPSPGPHVARLECVATLFRDMARDFLWRRHCKDVVAAAIGPRKPELCEERDYAAGRKLLERVERMGSKEIAALAKLFNLCAGVTPALLRERTFKCEKCQGREGQCERVKRTVEEDDQRALSKPHRVYPCFTMIIWRNSSPQIFASIVRCLDHQRNSKVDSPYILLQGLIMDFENTRFYAAVADPPFVEGEECPFCSSKVWQGFEEQHMFYNYRYGLSAVDTRIYCSIPFIVFYTCTKGHYRALQRYPLGVQTKEKSAGTAGQETQAREQEE